MFYRLKQIFRLIFPRYDEKDDKLAREFLSESEYRLFQNMSGYDKKHSINLLRDILKNAEQNDFKLLQKLALLHDIGKSKNYTVLKRIFYFITKNRKHCQDGYEILNDLDKTLAEYVLKHHDDNPSDKLLQIFKKFDDRN